MFKISEENHFNHVITLRNFLKQCSLIVMLLQSSVHLKNPHILQAVVLDPYWERINVKRLTMIRMFSIWYLMKLTIPNKRQMDILILIWIKTFSCDNTLYHFSLTVHQQTHLWKNSCHSGWSKIPFTVGKIFQYINWWPK